MDLMERFNSLKSNRIEKHILLDTILTVTGATGNIINVAGDVSAIIIDKNTGEISREIVQSIPVWDKDLSRLSGNIGCEGLSLSFLEGVEGIRVHIVQEIYEGQTGNLVIKNTLRFKLTDAATKQLLTKCRNNPIFRSDVASMPFAQ